MDYLKKSRIEEVLIAILGKGTVTSQLISRIEKILDTIRTDGSYDGPVMSEVEEILVCILLGKRFEKPTHSRIAAMLKVKANGGEYTELRKSRVEDLIFEWINAVESATYTGTLPATLQTVEGYLEQYKIYGNTVQDGTPTPENPIVPSECGERTGNLCDENNINQGYYAYADGQYGNLYTWVNTYFIAIKGNTEYTAKFKTIYNRSRWYGFVWYDSDKQYISTTNTQANPSGCELTATSPANASFCVFNICTHNTVDSLRPSDVIYFMLNLGSTALPYEPYGYKLPILSNSTVTNIYLGEAQTTRRIKKLVLTGDENCYPYDFQGRKGALVFSVLDANHTREKGFCSHYQVYPNGALASLWIGVANTNLYFVSIFDALGISTIDEFKSFLAAQYAAGTPVTIWYVLATEETGILNEPLRKIGDYADTIDSTQTSVQIPTFAGTTTISWAGEGLAPSEVELAYTKTK